MINRFGAFLLLVCSFSVSHVASASGPKGKAPSFAGRIGPEAAAARAVNRAVQGDGVIRIDHPRYFLEFSAQGVTLTPKGGRGSWK